MTASPGNRAALVILCVIAVVCALSLAETLLAPLTLAFVTAIILSPLNDWLRGVGVRPTLAALLTMLSALAGLALLAMIFRPWIADAIADWPKMRQEIGGALWQLRFELREVFDAQREVMEAIDPGAENGSEGGTDVPTLSDAAWLAPYALAQLVLFAGGLFFILVGKEDLYGALSGRFGLCRSGSLDAAERRVARYFGTVTLINLGFGAFVAIGLSLIGLPAAPLWGVIAAIANFVLYLGPATVAALLIAAGTIAFDGASALLPTAVFVGLNMIEGQFVTPTLLGRQMRLSPLLVFVSLAFWLWLWGPIGGIVAIPLLLWCLAVFGGSDVQPAPPSSAPSPSPSKSSSVSPSAGSDPSRASESNEAGVKTSRNV